MSLNDLPVEIFEMILKQLPIAQRIRNRRVDKRWRFVVDNSNPKRLVIATSKLIVPIGVALWPISKEPVWPEKNLLVKDDFRLSQSSFFESVFRMSMFSKIERLYISPDLFLTANEAEKCLNRLIRLKELKVNIIDSASVPKSCTLSLPSLESLAICWNSSDCDLILDMPNLNKVQVKSSSLPVEKQVFLYPEKITLFRSYSGRDCRRYLQFGQFINLQSVHLNVLTSVESNPLLDLPNLKELNFTYFGEFEKFEFMSRQRLLAFADKIKSLSKSKELQITYGGFYLNAKLADCRYKTNCFEVVLESNTENMVSVYLEQLDNLYPTLPGCSLFFENGSFNSLADRIPEGFLRKFIKLRILYLEGPIANEEKLIQLLDGCRCASELFFINCSLTDQFYSLVLTKKFPFLRVLEIKEGRPRNLNFLSQFAFLERIDVGLSAGVDLCRRMFQRLKFLKIFRFESQNTRYSISKEMKGFYDQMIPGNELGFASKYFDSLDDLLASYGDTLAHDSPGRPQS